MSLLAQALKKAERAKQHHDADEQLAKPSEAFDDMLELTPSPGLAPMTPAMSIPPIQPIPPVPPRAASRNAHADEPPLCALRLSPLEPAEHLDDDPLEARGAAHPAAAPSPAAHAGVAIASQPEQRLIRLLAILGVLLLIAAVFGYMVWRALYGAGSSRQLPMVPMPGSNGGASTSAPLTSIALSPDLSQPDLTRPSPADISTTATFNAGEPTAAGSATGAAAGNQPGMVNPPPPPLSDAEEVRRIAQENIERADRMDRVLNMNNPVARPPVAATPVPPTPTPTPALTSTPAARSAYVPPIAAYTAHVDAGASASANPSDSAPIRVAHGTKPEQLDPALQNGFNAFNQGDYANARQQYQSVLQRDAANRDALLGLAALAVHDRHSEQASEIYARLLATDPSDGDAMAGLSALRQADPGQSESRLRSLLARAPESAPALLALGNLYAREGRWQEAQQQFFKAYSAAPDNPDCAFNLAVGLDHLGQPALALSYYRKTLALAAGATASATAGGTPFDASAASARIAELERR